MIKLRISLNSIFIKFIFLITFLFFLQSKGQSPLFKSFDIRSENTKPRILKLFLDHNGLIWTGTDRGIFIFDGINFNKIQGSDSTGSVSAFFEDRKFNLWIGYENGKIVQINNQHIIPFQQKGDFPKVTVSAITEDNDGRIFFSTKGEGLYYTEKGLVINLNNNGGLSDDFCYDMIRLPDNRICVATDAGLSFLNFNNGTRKIETLGTSEGLPDDIVRVLSLGKNNELLIGMQEKGIISYDTKKNKFNSFLKNKWDYGQINHILLVDNIKYVATDEHGIIKIEPSGSAKILQLDSEKNIKANDLLNDIENNLWIAESVHLYRTSGNKIELINSIGEKQLTFIHCIISDKKGDIWFTPDQQLGHLYFSENGKINYHEYKITEGLTDIVSLYFDPYGFLWIGTMGSGVFRFNPETKKSSKITSTENVENSSILSITGNKDEVWVGGFNSVRKFEINHEDKNKITEKDPGFKDDKLFSDYVYSIFIDSRKRIWFGTDANGVYCWDRNFLKNISVPNNAVHGFTEDKKGRIWFSTANEGLEFVNNDWSVGKYRTKDGLSDPSPTSILCDYSGNIIIVHANGFDVLDPETKNIIYHSSEENLGEINSDLNSITMSPDSTIWLGTEFGIIHYRPAYDFKIPRPRIILQSVSVFPDKIDYHKKYRFDWDENNFRFDYDGLWYIDPQRINYYYLLEGYSTKWETTKDHTISFPKLPSSKYTFRIRASLNNSFDRSDEASFAFEILPPVWQRWWFKTLAALIITFIIVYIIRRREIGLRKFERLQKEKIEFQFETLKSQVNPHFLFNSFNTLLSIIENTPKNAIEYVERLSEFFRNIVTYRDKNLISVEEELDLLENYIFIQKKRYGENLRIDISLNDQIKKKLFIAPLTLQLLAENAIKHNAVSRETPLRIIIEEKNGRLSVSNNVNPKLYAEKSTGMGLQNIKGRYELLSKIPLEILKEENKFTVLIPLLKSEL
jgi:ligand-binding sensor domain-containing protein